MRVKLTVGTETKETRTSVIIEIVMKGSGHRGSTVVKVLCYKSEGLWFDPS